MPLALSPLAGEDVSELSVAKLDGGHRSVQLLQKVKLLRHNTEKRNEKERLRNIGES
jgi:hypothetical protein